MTLKKFIKHLPALINTVKKVKAYNNKGKNIRKNNNKIVKFWLSQKVEICININIKICLHSKTLFKFKILALYANLISNF